MVRFDKLRDDMWMSPSLLIVYKAAVKSSKSAQASCLLPSDLIYPK